MDGELGGETYIDVLLVSSALPPTKFHLDRERRFWFEFSVEKLVAFEFSRISRRDRKLRFFFFSSFFFACAALCQGQRFELSSPS